MIKTVKGQDNFFKQNTIYYLLVEASTYKANTLKKLNVKKYLGCRNLSTGTSKKINHNFFVLFVLGLGCNMSMPVSQEHIDYVVSLYSCFNDNTLGKLWTSSMPYLFPFIVEYR